MKEDVWVSGGDGANAVHVLLSACQVDGGVG